MSDVHRALACSSILAICVTAVPAATAPAVISAAQQRFDDATKMFEGGQWRNSALAYEVIISSLPAKSSRTRATASARRGYSLFKLGEDASAVFILEAALSELPADKNASLDRTLAHQALASIYEKRANYIGAAMRYRSVVAEGPDTSSLIEAQLGIARTTMFLTPVSAIENANKAYELAQAAKASEGGLGSILVVRGRSEYNAGRFGKSVVTLQRAVDSLGGFTNKLGLDDLIARGDLGIAAALDGNSRLAHQAFAFTGLGRDASLPHARFLYQPECGDFMQEDDRVIVEFGLSDNGTVSQYRPIYANRMGTMASSVAASVAHWEWPTEKLISIQPLFRRALRMEMRCSLASRHLSQFIVQRPGFSAWKDDIKLTYSKPTTLGPRTEQTVRRDLQNREASDGISSPTLIPILQALISLDEVSMVESHALAKRIAGIAQSAGAPPAARADLEINAILQQPTAGPKSTEELPALYLLRTQPWVASSPEARASVDETIAAVLRSTGRRLDAERILKRTVSDSELAATSKYRRNALGILYIDYVGTRRIAEAREVYIAGGMGGEPCALQDPVVAKQPRSSAYPVDASSWGFEGWVRVEFDITNEGKPENARLLQSFPPLVFNEAALNVLRKLTFFKDSSREKAGTCFGHDTYIDFKLAKKAG